MIKKISLVTGCSKLDGLGYHLVRNLLNAGHRVIATVRNLEEAEICKSPLANNNNLDLRRLDLCNKKSTQEFTKKILQEYGYIDVLVNNAANVMVGPVETASDDDLMTTYQTKVFGPLTLIRNFIPCMRERRSGLITTPGSIFSSMPMTTLGCGVYLSALIAFERIQDALAIELKPWNINVVNFHPGPIKTSLTRFDGSRNEIAEKYYKKYTQHAYSWFDKNTEWQESESVAKAFANMITQDNPDYFTYSNEFGRQFANKYLNDITGNSYLEDFLKHFKTHDNYAEDDWKI